MYSINNYVDRELRVTPRSKAWSTGTSKARHSTSLS